MTYRLRQGSCNRTATRMLCAIFVLALSGCTVGPDFVRPEAPSVEHYNQGTRSF